jgi:hypothetical protein
MAYKPRIRGGAIEYKVDLSSVECGCVSGVYLVALRHYGCNFEDERGPTAECNSIDVMQANPYGFNVAANPCAHGHCDAQSMCEYNMKKEGKERYGEYAYGPNGSMIDTNNAF